MTFRRITTFAYTRSAFPTSSCHTSKRSFCTCGVGVCITLRTTNLLLVHYAVFARLGISIPLAKRFNCGVSLFLHFPASLVACTPILCTLSIVKLEYALWASRRLAYRHRKVVWGRKEMKLEKMGRGDGEPGGRDYRLVSPPGDQTSFVRVLTPVTRTQLRVQRRQRKALNIGRDLARRVLAAPILYVFISSVEMSGRCARANVTVCGSSRKPTDRQFSFRSP